MVEEGVLGVSLHHFVLLLRRLLEDFLDEVLSEGVEHFDGCVGEGVVDVSTVDLHVVAGVHCYFD